MLGWVNICRKLLLYYWMWSTSINVCAHKNHVANPAKTKMAHPHPLWIQKMYLLSLSPYVLGALSPFGGTVPWLFHVLRDIHWQQEVFAEYKQQGNHRWSLRIDMTHELPPMGPWWMDWLPGGVEWAIGSSVDTTNQKLLSHFAFDHARNSPQAILATYRTLGHWEGQTSCWTRSDKTSCWLQFEVPPSPSNVAMFIYVPWRTLDI